MSLTEQTQRLFYVVTCNADKAREAEAARMWQRSFRGASSSFTTKSTFRDRDTIQRECFGPQFITWFSMSSGRCSLSQGSTFYLLHLSPPFDFFPSRNEMIITGNLNISHKMSESSPLNFTPGWRWGRRQGRCRLPPPSRPSPKKRRRKRRSQWRGSRRLWCEFSQCCDRSDGYSQISARFCWSTLLQHLTWTGNWMFPNGY